MTEARPDADAVAAENAKKIWHDDAEGDPLNEWRANMRLAYELGFSHGATFGEHVLAKEGASE